jgi:hypothetical protein
MMNYASTDPTAFLAKRKWRIRHSAWLLAPILGFGLLSFVGFVYVGLRVRTRKFWIALVVGCIGSAIVFVATEWIPGAGGGAVIMAAWIALVAYGFVLNRDYLWWRAGRCGTNPWYSLSPAARPDAHGRLLRPASLSGRQLWTPTQRPKPRWPGSFVSTPRSPAASSPYARPAVASVTSTTWSRPPVSNRTNSYNCAAR